MRTELSRRGLIGCVASLGLVPAISLRVEKFPVVETATAPLSDRRSPVQKLVEKYRALVQQHHDAYDQFIELYKQAVTEIGECPMDDGNEAWWSCYRETPAWTAEDVADDLLRQSDDVLTTLTNDTPSRTPADAAAKLRLVLEDDPLWECESREPYALWKLLEDLEALS